MPISLLSVPITVEDLKLATCLHQQGSSLFECLPLAIALRRKSPTIVVFTRRFVRIDELWWEPCRTTREAERQWAQTGNGVPYLARLELWPSCFCGRPRRSSARLCRQCQTLTVRPQSASEQIKPRDFHGLLRAVAERIQAGFANWPSRT